MKRMVVEMNMFTSLILRLHKNVHSPIISLSPWQDTFAHSP